MDDAVQFGPYLVGLLERASSALTTDEAVGLPLWLKVAVAHTCKLAAL